MLAALPDLLFVMTVDGVFVEYHVPDPENLLVPADRIVGMSLDEIFSPEEVARHKAIYARVARTGKTERFEYAVPGTPSEWFEARITRLDANHVLAISRAVPDPHRATFQRLVGEISSDYMRTPWQETDELFARTLERIAGHVDADRCYLVIFDKGAEGEDMLRLAYEWRAAHMPERTDLIGPIPVARFPWITGRIRAGEAVRIEDVEHIPAAGSAERENYITTGVRAVLAVPFVSSRGVIGYLGCRSSSGVRVWSDDTVEQVRVFGEMLARAHERKESMSALTWEQNLMEVLLDRIPDYIYFKDTEGRFIRVSRSLALRHGDADPRDTIGKDDSDRFSLEETAQRRADEEEIMRTGMPLTAHLENEPKADESERWISSTKAPFHDADGRVLGIVGISRDVTTEKLAQDAVAEYAHEQELLVREVYHRVKHTVSMIRSLVSLQANRVTDPETREVMRELEARILRMLAVYDHMDTAADFRRVPLARYLADLVRDVQSSFGSSGRDIEIITDLSEVEMDAKAVFVVGLIVNELLTNAWKHAFPTGAAGTILVRMGAAHDDSIRLTIEDNGSGIGDASQSSDQGLGMGLTQALVDQLQGDLVYEQANPGTRVVITVPIA
jgi:PAS domain S-box-containing protein